MFTSTKLRQIVVIDRAGSLSMAAQVMNISQSTLTKAVADIEKDLGYALFVRTARGVVATTEGREFLNRAERIVADFDMLIEDAKTHKAAGETLLRIGVSPASQEGLYNRIVARLLSERPELCLSLAGYGVERGVRMLKRGDVDLLFAPMEDLRHEKDFTTTPIGRLTVTLFCRKAHPLAGRRDVAVEDARAYKIVSTDYRSGYAQRIAGLILEDQADPLRHMHLIENFAIVVEAVAQTDLIGVVNKAYTRTRAFKQRFAEIELDVFDPIEIGAARLSRWMPTQAMKACLSVIQRLPIETSAGHSKNE